MLKTKYALGVTLAVICGGSFLQAAAPVNAAVKTNDEIEERLAWENRDSWGAAAPDQKKHRRISVHVLHNKTLVLSSDANAALGDDSHFSNVFIGQSPTKLDGFGTLLIDGGSLSLDGVMEVMRQGNYPGAKGDLLMTGNSRLVLTGAGKKPAYAKCKDEPGTLSVGANREGSRGGDGNLSMRDKASITLGRLVIGAADETQGKGRVTLEGSGVRILGAPSGIRLNSTGTLIFKADENGFGMIQSDGSLSAGKGARLAIDGSAYRGGSASFLLLRVREFSNAESPDFPKATLSGFDEKYIVRLEFGVNEPVLILHVTAK